MQGKKKYFALPVPCFINAATIRRRITNDCAICEKDLVVSSLPSIERAMDAIFLF
jgi:hypothetical protein